MHAALAARINQNRTNVSLMGGLSSAMHGGGGGAWHAACRPALGHLEVTIVAIRLEGEAVWCVSGISRSEPPRR
jgi:hypothetical protein